MSFVRNPPGISHSPDEYAEDADCEAGGAALADVLVGAVVLTADRAPVDQLLTPRPPAAG